MGKIYMIENLINQKKYIGQTIQNLDIRIKEHLNKCKSTKVNLHLYNAIRKYGFNNFKVTILKDNIPTEELDRWECYYIGFYDTFNSGYNNTIGGGGVRGYKHSEKTKQKISKTQLKHPERYTKERALKISHALKGKPFSKEHKKHLSESRLKNPIKYCGEANGFYGKHHTEESKKLMSDSSIKYNVLKLDEKGENITVFKSVQEAANYIIKNNLSQAKLSSVMYRIYQSCEGNQKNSYGFQWKYIEKV